MLRVYFTSFLLIALIAGSCGQNKKAAADTAGERPFVPNSFWGSFPKKPIGYTSDFARQFYDEEISFLDSICSAHTKETTNEIAIVTLNVEIDSMRTDSDFDSLSVQMLRHWGVGKKGKNNGVGIVISPNLRAISIRVGYGLEEKLTDAEAQEIIDDIMVPAFKQGKLFTGTRNALEAIINEIK